ncbi:TPA: hypothetical protein ACKQDN_002863 [Serratia marcescens]
MKKSIIIKWVGVFFTLSLPIGLSWANAPAVEIRVVGNLAAPGCSVITPNNGVYDLGILPTSSAKSTAVALAPLRQTWRIQCEADTYLKLLSTDNRAFAGGASKMPTSYNLLAPEGGDALGYYYVEISNATVNGKPARLLTQGGGDSATATRMRSGDRMEWGQAEGAMRSGRLFSADITIYPFLTTTGVAKSRTFEGEKLEGSMTMGFEFGL